MTQQLSYYTIINFNKLEEELDDNNYNNLPSPNILKKLNNKDKYKLYSIILKKIELNGTPDFIKIDKKVKFNWKQKYYYNLFEYLTNNYDLFGTSLNESNFLDFLNNLTKLNHGQVLLNKMIKTKDFNKYKNKINIDIIFSACKYGTLPTFLFWINYFNKEIINFSNSDIKDIIVLASINSDNRLYYYLLEYLLNKDKLFLQKNDSIIKCILEGFSDSNIPDKYILKRIKKLSEYISLVPYFEKMIKIFNSPKIIRNIVKYYYETSISFDTMVLLVRILNIYQESWNTELKELTSDYEELNNILKTDYEQELLKLIIFLEYGYDLDNWSYNILNQIIKKEYNKIIQNQKIYKYNNLKIFKYIWSYLYENNLITEFYNKKENSYLILNRLSNTNLFYTRFYSPCFNLHILVLSKIISINKVLHLLRLKAKRIIQKNNIKRKIKTWDLFKELTTFKPVKNIPVLSKGSLGWKNTNQKFNDLPPKHILPGTLELIMNKEIMLRDKADGILINNLPISIYPPVKELMHYKVKAEYIEEIDLYLVFDIDLPNSDIKTRYNYLRNLHEFTRNKELETINNFDNFMNILKEEMRNIGKFIESKSEYTIKWYPKFAVNTFINNIMIELKQLLNSRNNELWISDLIENNLYNIDGLILQPLDGCQELKAKPKDLLSIDLIFRNGNWYDKDGLIYTEIFNNRVLRNDKIYRLYPTSDIDLQQKGYKFIVGEIRFDKKHPNPTKVVNNIISQLDYDWLKENKQNNKIYYDKKVKVINRNIINILEKQKKLTINFISKMNPDKKANWLDLGCGKGKLIKIVEKYNYNYYLGLELDINQLYISTEKYNNNNIMFNHCDLSNNWISNWSNSFLNIKWSYIIANFSIMYFFNESLFEQLKILVFFFK